MISNRFSYVRAIVGFLILFTLYHTAEYMILFKNSALGFLLFQALFFFAAWLIARWQFRKGLSAWGFIKGGIVWKQIVYGAVSGVFIYSISYFISLLCGIEFIKQMPAPGTILKPLCLFLFGNLCSSFSEDILTRGYVYRHLKNRLSPVLLVLFSAALYLFNHIYRLHDGMQTYTYLFLLGVLFMIPVVKTGQIWTTGSMHWAGNCIFFITHEIIETDQYPGTLSSNYVLSGILLLATGIFILIYKTQKLKLIKSNK